MELDNLEFKHTFSLIFTNGNLFVVNIASLKTLGKVRSFLFMQMHTFFQQRPTVDHGWVQETTNSPEKFKVIKSPRKTYLLGRERTSNYILSNFTLGSNHTATPKDTSIKNKVIIYLRISQ